MDCMSTCLATALSFTLALSAPAPLQDAEAGSPSSHANLSRMFNQRLAAQATSLMLPHFAADAQVTVAGRPGVVPLAGTYTGPDEIAIVLELLDTAFLVTEVTDQYVVQSGDALASHIAVRGDVPSSGKSFDLELGLVWRFARGNKVASLHVFVDTYGLWLAFQPGGEPRVTDLRPEPNDLSMRAVPYDAGALIAAGYQAFFSGDLASALTLFTPESRWVVKGAPTVPAVGRYLGPDGFQQFVYNMLAVQQAVYVEPFPRVYWVLAEANRVEVYLMEPQMNARTGEVASTFILHSFALDEGGRLIQMDSFNDSYELYAVFGD
jgi:ketosteroid isomerase-like protein